MTKIELLNLLENVKLCGVNYLNMPELEKAIADIKTEVETATARKAGAGDVLRAAKSIAKTNDRVKIGIMNNVTYVCDGYQLLRTAESLPLESTETTPDMLKQFDKFFDVDYSDYELVDIPPVIDIKSAIAREKARKKTEGKLKFRPRPFVLSDGRGFNPNYLLNAVTASGCSQMYVFKGKKSNICPVIFKGEKCDYLLLPVRVSPDTVSA